MTVEEVMIPGWRSEGIFSWLSNGILSVDFNMFNTLLKNYNH